MNYITPLLAYGTLVLDLLFVVTVLAFLFRQSWGKEVVAWIGARATLLGLLVALGALVGSLLYSQVIGYAPCDLCWWQRVCLYPLVPIFAVALYKKYKNAYDYALPLAIIAGLIALYHTYIQLGGGTSILPCTAFGGACAKVYVLTFGYITIPTMSLTIAVWIILLAYIQRYYDKNRNT